MRIRLPATRSPPCLDAGRRGFATMRNPRESFPYFSDVRRTARVRRRADPSGELHGRDRDGPGRLRHSMRAFCLTLSGWGFGERATRDVAVALVCDWALPTAFRRKRGWPIGVRISRPGPRKGCPPGGTRSAAHAGRHAQRSEHGVAGKAASAAGQPGREAMRPERHRHQGQHHPQPRNSPRHDPACQRPLPHGRIRPCRRRARERSPCRFQ